VIGKNKIEQIYKEIAELNNDEKLLILKKLLLETKLKLKKEKKLNIYNIKGIGKEIWKNVDAQNYVNGERETQE